MKLDRVFAKPFVGNLSGHKDSVSTLCKHPNHLSILISGAFDGEVRVWNLPRRECTRSFLAHDGIVRGITNTSSENHFITIGDDKTIKTWDLESADVNDEPINTVISEVSFLYKNFFFPRRTFFLFFSFFFFNKKGIY